MSLFAEINSMVGMTLAEGISLVWNGEASASIQSQGIDVAHVSFSRTVKILTIRIHNNDEKYNLSNADVLRYTCKSIVDYLTRHDPSMFKQIFIESPDGSISSELLGRISQLCIQTDETTWHRDHSKEDDKTVVLCR